jgi:propanol-preferring alcohol dehydrogenase
VGGAQRLVMADDVRPLERAGLPYSIYAPFPSASTDAGFARTETLHATIAFAPAGALVLHVLRAGARGGRSICAGICISEIPALPCARLWSERSVFDRDLARRDTEEFIRAGTQSQLHVQITTFPLH